MSQPFLRHSKTERKKNPGGTSVYKAFITFFFQLLYLINNLLSKCAEIQFLLLPCYYLVITIFTPFIHLKFI